MNNYKLIDNLTGWIVFAIAALTYGLTIEPSVSFWDCGEFIAASHKMLVGHPPGAPFFMLVGKFFSLFAFGDVTKVAYMVNMMSALASAFTILFLFWTITHLARKLFVRNHQELTGGNFIAIFGSGVVGALAYTFSDTFWFSAGEGEVYALSSLFTAVVFWAILKWENSADEKHANRWLILIAYLMGLSIGVHLLNLLAIPAIVMVYYFRKYPLTKRGVLSASIIAVVVLGVIQAGIIPGLVGVSIVFEELLVNSMGMPYNSGMLFHVFLIVLVLAGGIYTTYFTENKLLNSIFTSAAILLLGATMIFGNFAVAVILAVGIFFVVYRFANKYRALLNMVVTMLAVIFIGYSSYSLIVIRSLADPTMDENNPDDPYALLSYLNRDQYGENPLMYGAYFNAPLDREDPYKQGDPIIVQRDGKYEVLKYTTEANSDPEFEGLFPRMWSPGHETGYMQWSGMNATDVYMYDENGRRYPNKKPSFASNMKYFFSYQVNWMYLRYFLWNFVGRQNDNMSMWGSAADGNWISGIGFLDAMKLGSQDDLPESMTNRKTRNTFYFLPLILGLLGLMYQLGKDTRNFWVVMLLFFFTGIAILLFLNQYCPQPRERDYAYAGSTYAFAIWIGLGVLQVYDWLRNKKNSKPMAGVALGLSLLSVPVLMGVQTWDDHDRSSRYVARDFARNYLETCAPNAILFTNGDNDTFPLWYAQEVEGIRTDVRVVNLSLLNTDWYIDQMRRKAYESDPLPIAFEHEEYVQGIRDYVWFYFNKYPKLAQKHIDLKLMMEWVRSTEEKHMANIDPVDRDQMVNFLPTQKFRLMVDSATVVDNGTVDPQDADKIVPYIDWTFPRKAGGRVMKSDLMFLDMLANNNWERPIYFSFTLGSFGRGNMYFNLEPWLQLEGMAYRLVPVRTGFNRKSNPVPHINTRKMYRNMMEKFKYGNMGSADVFLDETNRKMVFSIRSNFTMLADEYAKQGKNDTAIMVLDKCVEVLPPENVPYENFFGIRIAEIYLRAGATEKGEENLRKTFMHHIELVNYFAGLDEQYKMEYEDNILQSYSMVNYAIEVAGRHQLEELKATMEEALKAQFPQLKPFFDKMEMKRRQKQGA